MQLTKNNLIKPEIKTGKSKTPVSGSTAVQFLKGQGVKIEMENSAWLIVFFPGSLDCKRQGLSQWYEIKYPGKEVFYVEETTLPKK